MPEVGVSCLPCLFSTFSFGQGLSLNPEESTCSTGWPACSSDPPALSPPALDYRRARLLPRHKWVLGIQHQALVLVWQACIFLTEHLPGSVCLFLFNTVLAKTLECHLAQGYCFPSLGDHLSHVTTTSTSHRAAAALSPVCGVMNTDVRCSLPLLLAG